VRSIEIQHQVVPLCYGNSLPEDCFQDFYQLIVDGRAVSGAAEISSLQALNPTLDLSEVVPSAPVFVGFTAEYEP